MLRSTQYVEKLATNHQYISIYIVSHTTVVIIVHIHSTIYIYTHILVRTNDMTKMWREDTIAHTQPSTHTLY